MAFATKKDYCGLVAKFNSGTSVVLEIRDANENKSVQTYRAVDNSGAVIAEETFGSDSAPANSYALKATLDADDGDLQVGSAVITTVDGVKYALQSVTINTSAASPVQISAVAQQVESGASAANAVAFDVPAFTVTTRHVAQDIFSAISTQTNLSVTSLQAVISCNVTKDTITGEIISSDANTGTITITGTALQRSTANNAAAPAIAFADGWSVTSPLSCTNPETTYPTYSFTISKPLALAS